MEKEKVLETVLGFTLGLTVLFLVLKIKLLLFFVLFLAGVALLWWRGLDKPVRAWHACASLLSRGLSSVVLFISYIFFVVPLGYLHRRVHKNALGLEHAPTQSGYIQFNHAYTPSDFEHLW